MWSAGEWLLRTWAAGNELLNDLLDSLRLFEPVKYRGLLVAADGRLSDWDTLFSYIDAEGYTSAAIRAVFEHHAGKIRDAQLGSDKHLVWLDLWTALPRCSERTNLVLKLLSEGFGPKDIGRQIDGNGSRLVSAACAELSAALGEIFGGTTFALND